MKIEEFIKETRNFTKGGPGSGVKGHRSTKPSKSLRYSALNGASTTSLSFEHKKLKEKAKQLKSEGKEEEADAVIERADRIKAELNRREMGSMSNPGRKLR